MLVCITSYKGANPLLFNATIQQKPKTKAWPHSIVDGCSTRALQTLQGMALTSHYQLQFNIPPKCGLYLPLSATVQNEAGDGGRWVEIVSSILLQASSSALSCLAERLLPKHALQYVVRYSPWLQQRQTHSRGREVKGEKDIF